jgi:hypothetical protein
MHGAIAQCPTHRGRISGRRFRAPRELLGSPDHLGLSLGFEANLMVDDTGLVLRYEHLFERVTPAG